MKAIINTLILLAVFSISGSELSAQNSPKFNEEDIVNLITGIKSDNNGLMRSSIYFAGKYKIAESTDALLEVLDDESDPSNVILIALAIYKIGDREAMMNVIDTAQNTDNSKVKKMLSAIALQYLVDSDIQYVLR